MRKVQRFTRREGDEEEETRDNSGKQASKQASDWSVRLTVTKMIDFHESRWWC